MSSKEQLNGYIKRLKKTVENQNNEITKLTNVLRDADNRCVALSLELSKIKVSWFRRLLNRFINKQ